MDWPNEEYREIVYGVFPLTKDDGRCAYALACLIFIEKQPYDRTL